MNPTKKSNTAGISLSLLLVSSLLAAGPVSASDKPLIVKGKETFEYSYKVTIPPIEKEGRLWLPIAASDRFQKVELLGVTTHKPWQQTRDKKHGNRILTMNLSEADKHPELKDYYLGHHPANRFQFTLGRDLNVEIERGWRKPKVGTPRRGVRGWERKSHAGTGPLSERSLPETTAHFHSPGCVFREVDTWTKRTRVET